MKDKQEFENNLTTLMALDDKVIQCPPLPVKFIIDESFALSVTATEDKELLLLKGVDEKLLSTLASRILTLRYTESVWVDAKGQLYEAEEEWNANWYATMIFIEEMVHDFLFMYRNETEILQKIRHIAFGEHYPDIVQDLSDLAVIGENNPEPLVKAHYDMNKLQKAATSAVYMGDLLALINGEKNQYDENKDLRDRAFTYLNNATSEIRVYGRYIFWRNPEHMKKYTHCYRNKYKIRQEAATNNLVNS